MSSILACALLALQLAPHAALQPGGARSQRPPSQRDVLASDVAEVRAAKHNILPLPPAPAGPKPGNLALVGDTWTTIADGDRALHSDARLSPARIDAADAGGAAKAWSVRSHVTFDYAVVEAPGLLDPANDNLLFGHLAAGSPERAAAARTAQRRLVVIDETVDDLYGSGVVDYMEARGVDYAVLRLPMVEEEKSMDLVLTVCEAMKKFDMPRRGSPVIGIGGGVCLDVVGLAASLFRRKSPYVRVPTTTLSYVDASIGAKSGVNFMGSKNRLGAYVPPVAALLDRAFLATEEPRAVASGVSEMMKMALMKSPRLFELLEAHAGRLVATRFQGDDAVPGEVLQLSIATMLEELAPNLWESSLDRLVDFGHAFGQELEMHALGTDVELTHGEAVNVDMAYMTVLAHTLGLVERDEMLRILRSLDAFGCPIWHDMMTPDFVEHAYHERFQLSMGIRLPLPTGVGTAGVFNDVSVGDCLHALELYKELCGPGSAALADSGALRSLAAPPKVAVASR